MIAILLYILLVSMLHAQTEIMIEDKSGWARSLPCWRVNVFATKVLLGKELSGYHCYMLLLFATLFHSPFLFIPWSWFMEARVWGLFLVYWVLEDFFWFCFNKHYRIMAFRKGKISWHIRWFLGLPVSYWISLISAGVLLLLGRH